MKTFKAVVLSLAAAAALAVGSIASVNAQTAEPTAFKNVRLWVNPEYDDPRLLVMIEGQIVGAQAPAPVRFLVPSSAEMYSAGSKDASGEYSGGPPDRKESSIPGWDEISYTLTANTFRVEYYDSVGELPDKQFTYEFLRLYPVQDLTVVVQEPKQSTNFTVNPQGKSATDTEGFKVQSYSYTNLDLVAPVEFDISYTRTSSQPSIPTTSAGGSSSSNTGLIVAVVAIAVVLGGGGLYLMSRSNRKPRPVNRATRRGAAGSGKTRTSQTASPSFCSQCGRKLDRGERFCPDCGTAV